LIKHTDKGSNDTNNYWNDFKCQNFFYTVLNYRNIKFANLHKN